MFKVYIDWDADNDFTDSYDDVSAYVIDAVWEQGIAEPYGVICDDSYCNITLRNDDGRFNPEDSSSPLYNKILPRRPLKIEYNSQPLFYGFVNVPIASMRPAGVYTGKTEVVVEGYGYKQFLDNLEPTLQIYSNVTTDVIIEDVLSQVTLPVSGNPTLDTWSNLETGKYTVKTYGDISNVSAWQVLQEMVTAEQGRLFFDRGGTVTFYNRHHIILQTSTAGTITGSQLMSYDYGYGRYLANRIRATATPRQTGATETLWTLDNAITIPPNSSINFDARLRKSTGQFAGGVSLTATPSFSAGTATVTVVPQGGKASVTVVNASTSQVAILDALTIDGVPTVQQNIIDVVVADNTSINSYGLSELQLALGSVVDYTDCASIAQYELTRRKNLTGDIRSITLKTQVNNNYWQYQIGDKIRIDLSALNGHVNDYIIIAERNLWNVGGIIETTYILEPSASNQFWLLGVSGYSELGQTTILAY